MIFGPHTKLFPMGAPLVPLSDGLGERETELHIVDEELGGVKWIAHGHPERLPTARQIPRRCRLLRAQRHSAAWPTVQG